MTDEKSALWELAPGLLVRDCGTACPTQWEGTVDGEWFYFRHRFGGWTFHVYRHGYNQDVQYEQSGRYGDNWSGVMLADHARRLIFACAELFRLEGVEGR